LIYIAPGIAIDEREFHEEFIRASGPGGQNVNKVASAVQLRFDIRHSSLPERVRERLIQLAGRRVNANDILLIQAQRFRTQEQNRADARARLVALIRRAAVKPKARQKTRPSRASKQRRLASKKHKSQIKWLRSTGPLE